MRGGGACVRENGEKGKMKTLRKFLSALFAVLVFCLGVFGCGRDKTSDGDTNGEQTDPAADLLTDKVINKAMFKDPDLRFRPMVMVHGITQNAVNDAYARGYGGIVTNVAWNNNYLNDVRAFNTLAMCIEQLSELGMYAWLYDEYGYPSGTAYGQTLKDNPEYEALGLVPQYKTVAVGTTQSIDLLHGHTAIISAYTYDGTDRNDIDLFTGEDVTYAVNADKTRVTFTNRTATSKVLVAYMRKPWYENTHSMENWYAQQRYINMLEKEPTQKFIRRTHEQYYDYLGEHFGNTVKAFFTDEPALQGSYFTITDRPRQVLHQPDPDVPIVECLNYSDTLFEVFKEKYGYDLKPYLGYLYNADGGKLAKQVRMDFYALTGDLFGQNYLGQIEEWCRTKNVKSSGHLLLEETLYQNPWFAGNMIQLLGTMGIPGTDLLYSKATTAMTASCIVSKMASSAADFQNKTETFAEISGAFDGTAGKSVYDKLNAVGVQVCMGINNFASYYFQGSEIAFEDDKIFSAAIGRMKYMVDESKHRANVAVYYPYEGVSAETLPSLHMYQPTQKAKDISDAFTEMCRAMTERQVDYDLIDWQNLSACSVQNGALVTPSGERFTAIVLPHTTALRSETVEKLLLAQQGGVKVVLQGIDDVVCERGKNDVAAQFADVKKNAASVATGIAAAKYVIENGHANITIEGNAAKLYCSKRVNKNYTLITAVNAYESDKSFTFRTKASGKSVKYYDTVTGDITEASATFADGVCTFTHTLPANQTGFFVID